MSKNVSLLFLLVVAVVPQLSAETMTGGSSGTVDSVEVEAATKTHIIYAAHGETPSTFVPWPFDGDWSFDWTESGVDFEGVFHFGDYQSITDAGSMGGVTKQVFYDFAHHVRGRAEWDRASRTLSFMKNPEGRDDSGASTATQSKEPDCVTVRGLFAGKACAAFRDTSPGLEGMKLEFRFSEDRSRFEGQAILIQYGGKGVTESETTITVHLYGDLAPR